MQRFLFSILFVLSLGVLRVEAQSTSLTNDNLAVGWLRFISSTAEPRLAIRINPALQTREHQKGDEIVLSFSDKQFIFTVDSVKPEGRAKVVSLSADNAEGQLVFNGNKMYAEFSIPGGSLTVSRQTKGEYEISYQRNQDADKGGIKVEERDTKKQIESTQHKLRLAPGFYKSLQTPVSLKASVNAVGDSVSRDFDKDLAILFVYDEIVEEQLAYSKKDLLNSVAGGVRHLNRALEANQLGYTASIAGVMKVDMSAEEIRAISPTHKPMDMFDLQDSYYGYLLAQYMYAANADLIVVVSAEREESVGRGTISTSFDLETNIISSLRFGSMFSTVTLGYLGGKSMAHEIGHNLGLEHDRETLANDELGQGTQHDYHIPYGYVAEEAGAISVMAYYSACPSCTKLDVFSDPDYRIKEIAFGKGKGEADAADAVSALRQALPATAQASQTRMPLNLTYEWIEDDVYKISWPEVAGAQSYLVGSYCDSYSFSFNDDGTLNTYSDVVETSDNYINLVSPYSVCVFAKGAETGAYMLVGKRTGSAYGEGFFIDIPQAPIVISTQKTAIVPIALPGGHQFNNQDISLSAAWPYYDQQERFFNDFLDLTLVGEGQQRELRIRLKQSLKEFDGVDHRYYSGREPLHLTMSITENGAEYYNRTASIDLYLYLNEQNARVGRRFVEYEESKNELESWHATLQFESKTPYQNVQVTQIEGPQQGLTRDISLEEYFGYHRADIRLDITKVVTDQDGIITFKVSDDSGQLDETINLQAFRQDIYPEVHITSSQTNIKVGDTVAFRSVAFDSDGEIVGYHWALSESGAPVITDASAKDIEVKFENAGQYTLSLTVTDNEGLTSSTQYTVNVGQQSTSQPGVTGGGNGGSGGGLFWLLALFTISFLQRRVRFLS